MKLIRWVYSLLIYLNSTSYIYPYTRLIVNLNFIMLMSHWTFNCNYCYCGYILVAIAHLMISLILISRKPLLSINKMIQQDIYNFKILMFGHTHDLCSLYCKPWRNWFHVMFIYVDCWDVHSLLRILIFVSILVYDIIVDIFLYMTTRFTMLLYYRDIKKLLI